MTLKEVLPEIAITRLLSDLAGSMPYYYSESFVQLTRVNIAQGGYPKVLDDAWVKYSEERESENDRPAKLLKSNQLWLVLQLSNGGVALEDFKVSTVAQAQSIFDQVALALAVGESRFEFEHRDLHVGNILIKEVEADTKINFELRGDKLIYDTKGVQVTIIDFSLSRAVQALFF